MKNLFTANRIAAVSAFLLGLATAIVGITNNFPHSWQPVIGIIVGILTAFGTALHFMLGSQKIDQQNNAIQMKQLDIAHEQALTARARAEEALLRYKGNTSDSTPVSEESNTQEDTQIQSIGEETSSTFTFVPAVPLPYEPQAQDS